MKQGALVNISLVFALLALTAFICLIASFLNKGFELSDESYYLLCTKYPFDTKLLVSSFGLISHRLCFGLNDLFSLRLFKLIYQMLCLTIFARAFFLFGVRNLKVNRRTTFLLSVILIIAGLANYDYLPMTLSYNSWSLNFGLLFWAGLMFANSSETKRGIAFSNMLMGISVLFLFYAKAPNAIVLAFVFVMYIAFYQKGNMLNSLLLFGLGKLIGIIILFLSFEVFQETTSNLVHNILNTRQAPAGGYFTQMGELISVKLGYKFVLVQILVVGLMYVFRRFNFSKGSGIKLLFANTIFTFSYLKGNSADISNDFIVFAILGINCIAVMVLVYAGGLHFKDLLIPIFLILTPFMLAAGTSNPIFYTSSQMFVFSLTGLFLLLLRSPNKEIELFYAYSALFICFFIGSFLYNGMIKHPYRQSDLSKKSIELPKADQIKNINENEERSQKYNELATKLRTHNKGHLPVLSSPSTLGTLMMAEMDPFAVCWICDPDNEAMSNDEYFKKLDLFNNKPFLMITKGMYNSEKQFNIFKAGGMNFRLDYSIMDSVYLEWNKEYYYLMQPVKNV